MFGEGVTEFTRATGNSIQAAWRTRRRNRREPGAANKFRLFDLSFSPHLTCTLWPGVIGGVFLTAASAPMPLNLRKVDGLPAAQLRDLLAATEAGGHDKRPGVCGLDCGQQAVVGDGL